LTTAQSDEQTLPTSESKSEAGRCVCNLTGWQQLKCVQINSQMVRGTVGGVR
jgi:hypothetical protein